MKKQTRKEIITDEIITQYIKISENNNKVVTEKDLRCAKSLISVRLERSGRDGYTFRMTLPNSILSKYCKTNFGGYQDVLGQFIFEQIGGK